MIIRTCAASVAALTLMVASAQAAPLPEAGAQTGLPASGTLQLALPQPALNGERKLTQVAQRRRGRARRWRRRRRVGAGVAIGLGVLGIAAAIAAAERREEERRLYRRQCRRWAHRCDLGNYRSCRLFERECY